MKKPLLVMGCGLLVGGAVFLISHFSFLIAHVFADEPNISCDNRYLTLVNPVRGRELWYQKDLQPIVDQYGLIERSKMAATWLLQDDVFSDRELLGYIRSFNSDQEKGVFLEISQAAANRARVIYPYDAPWFSPRAVFLSGYSQSDRRKLVDRIFADFKNEFGVYPKSVGAWWIDSYSLGYMIDKYQITSAMIVADQLTTDSYGVWGQWWGVPYYPSKANVLTPASDLKNKLDVVVVQWAQRDPELAYGEGPKISNFSLQANDYIRQGKDTSYFLYLAKSYLSCGNKLGQITVGLETGIESVGYIEEYGKQLKVLKNIGNLQAVTISQFAERFAKVYPEFPEEEAVSSGDSLWHLNTKKRLNQKLGDEVFYNQKIAFSDFFVADKSDFLNRVLPKQEVSSFKDYRFVLVIVLLGLLLLSIFRNYVFIWFSTVLFILSGFGLVYRSGFQNGWLVFYGPVINELLLAQVLILIVTFLGFLLLNKQKFVVSLNKKLLFLLIPLSFGFDFVIQSLRFTNISGKYYLGVGLDSLRFFGVSFAKPFSLQIVNRDFQAYQAAAFLRFNFEKVWDNLWLLLLVYPLVHIVLGVVVFFTLNRFPKKIRNILLVSLILLYLFYLLSIYNVDPRKVMRV